MSKRKKSGKQDDRNLKILLLITAILTLIDKLLDLIERLIK